MPQQTPFQAATAARGHSPIPPATGGPAPDWEESIRRAAGRAPDLDLEESIRKSLRGSSEFQGGKAGGPGMFSRAASWVGSKMPSWPFGGGGTGASAAPAAAPAESGPGFFGSVKQGLPTFLGGQNTLAGLIKAGGRGLARGTVLSPSWWAAMGTNAAGSAAGLEDVLRGKGGVAEGDTSIGRGMSNLAHAVPGAGGLIGAAYDWTLGPLASAASTLGDVAGAAISAPFSERARQDLGRMGSNLGSSLSSAWSGKPASVLNDLDMSDPQVQELLKLPNVHPGGGPPGMPESPLVAGGATGGGFGELGAALGTARMLAGTPGHPSQAHRSVAANYQAEAPKSPDAPPTTGQSAAGPPASPISGNDSLEAMLMRRMQASQNPANYLQSPSLSFSVAGPIDPGGMYNFPMPHIAGVSRGQGGSSVHYGSSPLGSIIGLSPPFMPPEQPQFPADPNGTANAMARDFDLSLAGVLGIHKNAAAMMAAHADMKKAEAAQAGDLGGYNNPLGHQILERQYPGISSALKFPGIADTPAAQALEANKDATPDDWIGFWEMAKKLQPENHRIDEYVRDKLSRFGPAALDASGQEGWFDQMPFFGDKGAGARRNRMALYQLGF